MKILYVYIGGGKQKNGVTLKVTKTISAMNEYGWKVEGLFVKQGNKDEFDENEQIKYLGLSKIKSRYFSCYKNVRERERVAFNWIVANHSKYDYIYLRYPGASANLYMFLKKLGNKTIVEHNTDELSELKMLGRKHKFGLNPSAAIGFFEFWYTQYFFEWYYSKRSLPYARLGLVNTPEGVQIKNKRIKNYHVEFFSNGIDFNKIRLKKHVPITDCISLVVLRGSAQFVLYDGLDRLLKGLCQYKGKLKLRVNLLGSDFTEIDGFVPELPKNVEVIKYGRLTGERLDSQLDECHLSIGTLALHRKNMKQASVLRVNESLARGIPVAVAYQDVELNKDDAFKPYFIQLEASDKPIDVGKLISFAHKVQSDPQCSKKLRNIAKRHLSLESRFEQLRSFI